MAAAEPKVGAGERAVPSPCGSVRAKSGDRAAPHEASSQTSPGGNAFRMITVGVPEARAASTSLRLASAASRRP